MAGGEEFYRTARVYVLDYDIYMVRDVVDVLNKMIRVEYAVYISFSGETIWKPTYEGVQFDDIEPFARVHSKATRYGLKND
jgi:Tfp pilus assembly protein PilZ